MHTLPAPYFTQDGSYRPRRRHKKHRTSFHPTITDDLGSGFYDEDDDFYYLQNPPAYPPYWQGQQPYSAYPPPPQYPAPYPYQQYPQYPPPHDPRRPESNFGMLLAGAFVFAITIFGAVWYDNAHEKATPQPGTYSNEGGRPVPPQEHSKPAVPKRYLKPITEDVFAVYLESFGTEAEVTYLGIDLERSDITTVQMGDKNFWACILVPTAEAAESIRAEVAARYEQKRWKAEPFLINLRDNCTGLERRGDKLVCGEK